MKDAQAIELIKNFIKLYEHAKTCNKCFDPDSWFIGKEEKEMNLLVLKMKKLIKLNFLN